MKRRGVKRRFDPSIPSHIDQQLIPVGFYWDRRSNGWYRLYMEDGRRRRENVADGKARNADLITLAEAARGEAKGTLAHVLEAFEKSGQFAELAKTTQRGYRQCRGWLVTYRTKSGETLAGKVVDQMTRPYVQRLIDKIAADTPSKANAMLRYLRRTLRWAQNRGHCKTNPADGIEQARERKEANMPERDVMAAVLAFAQARGDRTAYTEGSCAPYLWIVMELAYLCRLRSIEVLDLTLASATEDGVQVERRKGSRGNLTTWNPRLRAVWDAALELRQRALTKRDKDKVVQIKPAQRQLILSDDGSPLTIEGLRSAWDRFIKLAISEKVITADQRFSLHGLKHRGITDTDRAEKRAGGGHVTDAMAAKYDHEVPVVSPAGE